MGYIIDTSIWVDVERGHLAPGDIAAITKDEPVYLSPVTIAELKYGVEVVADLNLKHRRQAALNRIKSKPTIKVDQDTGEIFGSLAATLKASGRGHHFRIQDLWIASQAVQHGYKLLTRNPKDFLDIPGLETVVIPT